MQQGRLPARQGHDPRRPQLDGAEAAFAAAFLAVPFPFAGAAVALGLIGREGRRRGLAGAGIVLGAVVLVLGAGAYAFELLA